jgi:hypothetical protein
MIAMCVRAFLDAKTGEMRREGERFETDAERLADINSTKYGQLAVEVEEEAAEAVTAPQKPKRTRRRTRKKE